MARPPETSESQAIEGPHPLQRAIHPSLAAIVSAFGFIGFTSFGGARAAYFRHAMVVSHRWLTDDQFLEGLTISQILPGPNISNLSVYLGQRLRGLTGATLAVIAVLLPGTVMIVALAMAYFGHGNLPGLPAVFKGVGAAAVGLSLATTLQVGVKGLRRRRDWLIVLITFLAVEFLRVSLLIPLLTIAPISVWMNRPSRQTATLTHPQEDSAQ